MASTMKQTGYGSPLTGSGKSAGVALDTELALAAGALGVMPVSYIDNSILLAGEVDFELSLTFASAPTAGACHRPVRAAPVASTSVDAIERSTQR